MFFPACLAAYLLSSGLSASGDGARVHAAAPVDTNFLIFHGSILDDANRTFDPSLISPLLRFDTSIATIQYARTTSLRGRYVMFTGLLRGGNTTRKSNRPEENASSSGFADPTIAASINLLGLPPLRPEAFRDYQPQTVVNLFLALTLPLGEYTDLNLVNLGSNRYTLRVGFPVVHPVDLFAGKRTTLELVPNLHLFSENKSTGLKQNALFTLEGNMTQDLSTKFWGALGFLYSYGGKTEIGGVEQNGTQRSLGLTATLSYQVTPRWAINVRYGDTVARNEFGLDGSLYHLKLVSRF